MATKCCTSAQMDLLLISENSSGIGYGSAAPHILVECDGHYERSQKRRTGCTYHSHSQDSHALESRNHFWRAQTELGVYPWPPAPRLSSHTHPAPVLCLTSECP